MVMDLFIIAPAILFFGGFLCVAINMSPASKLRMGTITSVLGAFFAICSSSVVLVNGQTFALKMPWQIPFGSFHIALDGLSAFFVVIIAFVSAVSAIYGEEYLKEYAGHKNIGALCFFYNLLFASMLLIVVARDGILFLLSWEAMSLTSFFLVMFEHEKAEVREAGWIYLVAAHLGAACLMALFSLLSTSSTASPANFDFDNFTVSNGMANALFVLALFGFGAKAGFVPMHVWLPKAHPAAPSHISAVMSGVMVKTGIYGIIRVLLFLGTPPTWWGATLIGIGLISGIYGILMALTQNNLKQLLAYSTVENIGIICLGLGLWLLGISSGSNVLATLGLCGALLHTFNHAIIKSIMFLGAGAIKHATNTLNIDELGGLKKKMPQTSFALLVGCIAICGLPPLNGFVGELFIYLGAFEALKQNATFETTAAGGMLVLLSLALIGGLAAACFVKLYGIIFLGEPRSQNASTAHEVAKPMWQAMLILAVLSIILGIGAPLGVFAAHSAIVQIVSIDAIDTLNSVWKTVLPFGIVGFAIVFVAFLFWVFRAKILSRRTVTEAPTWDCGYTQVSAKMQYTASSFSMPIVHMFRRLLLSKRVVQIEQTDFPEDANFSSNTDDVFMEKLFAPVFNFIAKIAAKMHNLQHGRNQLYIFYIAVALLVLLLFKLRQW